MRMAVASVSGDSTGWPRTSGAAPAAWLPYSRGSVRLRSAFYVRMSVADRPGVLARVASAFAEEHLSIRTVVQSGTGDEAQLVLVLHAGVEDRMRAALARVGALDDVRGEPVMLRVLGSGEGAPG